MVRNMDNNETIIAGDTAPSRTAELDRLYPGMSTEDIHRRLRLATDGYRRVFGRAHPRLFSAPGRTELIGNHTDHQHGPVIAGAVALDDIAAAAPSKEMVIRIYSDTYGFAVVDLGNLSPQAKDAGTPASLVRGVAEYFAKRGYGPPGGFNAYISGLVPVGSGLSSSAAFEVLVAAVMNGLFHGGRLPAEFLARAGQYAENIHFGKPCGLMDQMASAAGGIINIDFKTPEAPRVERLPTGLSDSGYALCIIDTGAAHDHLKDEYAAIPAEMRSVANLLNGDQLNDIQPERFYAALPEMGAHVSHRALLRAMHFFEERHRVGRALNALKNGDFDEYLTVVRDSGRSSWTMLQNIYPGGSVSNQSAALALAWCERLLGGKGTCRIHGGGFGGTIQAFVPVGNVQLFMDQMERLTGKGSCRFLQIRDAGAVEIIL
jgi:galactokinase